MGSEEAQNDCQSRQRQGVPLCSGDPTSMIRDLELQTTQAFKGNSACNGLTLVTLNVSEDPSRLNSRNTWWLFLELMRSNEGPNELRYTVSSDHDPHRLQSVKGQGRPDSIVWEFCSFVRKGG